MNHKSGFNPLSRTAAHQRAMSRNMVTSLLRYERITTTKAKAKEVRKAAEKIITRGKVDSVHNRRQVARFIWDQHILAKLFTDIGPRMKDRPGGYTRILKLGFRANDAADMVILELVDYVLKDKSKKDDGKKAKPEKASKTKKTDKKQDAKSMAPRAAKSATPKSTVNRAAKAAPAALEKPAAAESEAEGKVDKAAKATKAAKTTKTDKVTKAKAPKADKVAEAAEADKTAEKGE